MYELLLLRFPIGKGRRGDFRFIPTHVGYTSLPRYEECSPRFIPTSEGRVQVRECKGAEPLQI